MSEDQDPLGRLQPLDEFFAARRNVFQSKCSGEWFVRRYKAALIDAGALLRLNNRFFADVEKFEACVVEFGKEEARRRSSRGAA